MVTEKLTRPVLLYGQFSEITESYKQLRLIRQLTVTDTSVPIGSSLSHTVVCSWNYTGKVGLATSNVSPDEPARPTGTMRQLNQ